MENPLPHKIAKQRVVDAYLKTRRTKAAADAAGVPYATADRWLVDAGLKQPCSKATGLTQWDRAVTGPKSENLPRVDRDPCPKCGTRRDVGCNHYRKDAEPERPITAREKAERIWKGLP